MKLTTKQTQHLLDKMESGGVGVPVEPSVQYYQIGGWNNVARDVAIEYSYLDHETGQWIKNNGLIAEFTGFGGDAVSGKISKQEAQAWVKKHHPGLSVEWL